MLEDMLGSALAEVAGPQKDFWEKVGGPEGRAWVAAFKQFLRKENPWSGLRPWRNVKLGTGLKTADEFRQALKEGGFKIGDWGNDILSQPAFDASIASSEIELELCIATTAELVGKEEGGTTSEVFAGIKRLGGELCPAELGPQLRLRYRDQPKGEWLLIAMEPITDSDGGLKVFRLGHGAHGLWLDGLYGNPDDFWRGDDRWVFVRPRKSR